MNQLRTESAPRAADVTRSSRPKVSVATIAYNQRDYIADAIESVVAQKCDFDIEYVIGDDGSTDGTAEILSEYARRYPGILTVVTRETNIGAQRNLADVLSRCSGRYLALLDGDDFWTSRQKLQKQVDFLDANPTCAVCFHAVQVVEPDGTPRTDGRSAPVPERTDIRDLLKENYISTCSVMYRWGLIGALPEWWPDTWIGDYPLHVLHARHGWIGYIDEVLAAYRAHESGLWSGERATARAEEFLKTLQYLDKTMEYEFHDEVQQTVYRHRVYQYGIRFERAFRAECAGGRLSDSASLAWLVAHARDRGDIPLREVLVLVAKGTAPWLVRALVALKRLARGERRSVESDDAAAAGGSNE